MKSVRMIIARQSFNLLCLSSLILAGCGSVTPTNQLMPAPVSPSPLPSPVPHSTSTVAPAAENSFENDVRQGNICAGPLALQHDSSLALSNEDKTKFIALDQQTVGQMQDFAWSPDGTRLAVIGQNVYGGNIYITDSAGAALQPVLPEPIHLNINQVTWSPDGKQLLVDAIPMDLDKVYLMNVDGTGFVATQSGKTFLASPQFTADGKSIIYPGTDSTSAQPGLYETTLDGSQTRIITDLVTIDVVFSPDSKLLAYIEFNQNLEKADLVVEDPAAGAKTVLGTLPYSDDDFYTPNLSWSPDGKLLVFDFGSGVYSSRAVYLAHVDSTGLAKLADDAHAPTISPDGRCLAYSSNKQVFVLDLVDASSASPTVAPVFLADIPTALSYVSSGKLQWAPTPTQQLSPRSYPIAQRYVIQEGDTISKIAEKFNISPEQLMQANGITSLLYGPTLIIPAPIKPVHLDDVLGSVEFISYSNPDLSLNTQYRFFNEEDGSYLELKGNNLEPLQNVECRPIKIWGNISIDESGTNFIDVEKFEIPYSDLQFQIFTGTQEIKEINGETILLFTTDGTTYVLLGPIGSHSVRGYYEGGVEVFVTALQVPEESYAGYPALRVFEGGRTTNPVTGGPEVFPSVAEIEKRPCPFANNVEH